MRHESTLSRVRIARGILGFFAALAVELALPAPGAHTGRTRH